jgi:hypothetical protein
VARLHLSEFTLEQELKSYWDVGEFSREHEEDSMESKKPPNNAKDKPLDIERWEGEGGHPPLSPCSEPESKITAILRKLLIGLHIEHAKSNK